MNLQKPVVVRYRAAELLIADTGVRFSVPVSCMESFQERCASAHRSFCFAQPCFRGWKDSTWSVL